MTQQEKFVKFTERDLLNIAQEQKWEGLGTKDNPYIIESTEGLPRALIISKSLLNLSFKNCKLNRMRFKTCQNISFDGCELYTLVLSKCSRIEVKNVHFNRALVLKDCNNINIDYCAIPFLDMYLTFESSFKHCSIDEIDSSFSRGNLFEENEIPEPILTILKKEGLNITQIAILISFCGGFAIGLNYFLKFLGSNSPFLFLSGMGLIVLLFGFIVIVISFIIDTKKMKKYPPNEIK